MKNDNQTDNRIQKRAGLIFVFVILLAIFCILFLFLNGQKKGGHVAVIYQNGEIVDTIDLNKVTKAYDLRFENERGNYNIVHVEHGKISITEASCPDKLCIHAGKITNNSLPITCLPNKLVIQIENAETTELDAVSY